MVKGSSVLSEMLKIVFSELSAGCSRQVYVQEVIRGIIAGNLC